MIALTLAVGCAHGGLPTAEIEVAGIPVVVEVADEEGERGLGLMYREKLAADRGMLFVYPDAQVRSFWMKDTRIPLTIAYIGADGRIVTLADMKPLDRSSVPSDAPAQYALEMNRGWFDAHGVKVGAVVTGLPAGPAKP